jgi:hypothetical protein
MRVRTKAERVDSLISNVKKKKKIVDGPWLLNCHQEVAAGDDEQHS